jgi:peptide-methionine (S)-S-oxide reductase
MLKIFWENHDSTACHSRQYMSAIFYHDSEQERIAKETKEEHQKKVSRTIQTKIAKAETFYDAEE